MSRKIWYFYTLLIGTYKNTIIHYIEPLSKEEAIVRWEELSADKVEFEDAFPGETVEEA